MAHGRSDLEKEFSAQQRSIQRRLANTPLTPMRNSKLSSVALTMTDVDIHVELSDGSMQFSQNLHGDADITSNSILAILLTSYGSLAMQDRIDGHFKPNIYLELPQVQLDLHINSSQAQNTFHQSTNARIKANDHHLNIVLSGGNPCLFSGATTLPLNNAVAPTIGLKSKS